MIRNWREKGGNGREDTTIRYPRTSVPLRWNVYLTSGGGRKGIIILLKQAAGVV